MGYGLTAIYAILILVVVLLAVGGISAAHRRGRRDVIEQPAKVTPPEDRPDL